MARILLKNVSWIVTVDKERRIIKDGAIAVDGTTISAVGKADVVTKTVGQAEFELDGRNMMATPGLVDGHLHNSQELARGIADEVDIYTWLYKRVYPFEAEMTDKETFISAQLSQLEMIRAGTTCFYDPCSFYPEQVAQVTEESGMRGAIARFGLDIYEIPEGTVPVKKFRESTEQILHNGEEFVRKWNGACNGRIRGAFSLRNLNDSSNELCTKTGELAKKYKVLIETHGDANEQLAASSKKVFGATGLERLHKLGILGPRVLMIHMGGITLGGLLLMKETGAKGVVCPAASAHHGGSTSRYLQEIIDLDLDVCLGSDSGAEGNFLDVVRAMNFASLSTKRERLDSKVMRPEDLIEMATLRAARAGSWESEIGSLEAGKKADITLFDMHRPETTPVYNPIANLVYCASGQSADTVIVDGEILMEDRKVNTLNEADILEKAQEAGVAVANRSGLISAINPAWPIV